MMNLAITTNAIKYLRKLDSDFTIKMKPVGSGCCIVMVPTVEAGRPDKVQNYNKISKENLDFYFWNELTCPTGDVTISLKGHLMFKSLKIDGVLESV